MKIRHFLITAMILISIYAVSMPSIAKADIHVYDNNDQYLGILLGMWGVGMDLFIPSAGGVLKFLYNYEDWCEEIHVFFQSSDCSGTPYDKEPNPKIFDYSIISLDGFYKVDYNGKQTFTPGSGYSYSCDCQPNPGAPNAEYYPLIQVQPFTTPIALPLRFEVESNSEIMPFPIVVPSKNQ